MKREEPDKLKSCLYKYSDLTLNILRALEEDTFEKLEGYLTEREEVIKDISFIDYEQSVFNEICTDLKLIELQEKLNQLAMKKSISLREEIEKMGEMKTANRSYNKGFAVDSIYFNKKI